ERRGDLRVGPAPPARPRVAVPLRRGAGARAAEPRDVGDRGPRRRRVAAHRDARPARSLAEDGRECRRLDADPPAPQDGARNRKERRMTTMTEQTVQVYAVFLRASAEQVWDAITKPEFTTRYFYGSVLESTYEPGASYTGWSEDRSVQYVDGEVIEAV